MKKKILGVIAMIAFVSVVSWNLKQSKAEIELSDLALSNVEAIARNEYDEKIWERFYHSDGTYGCSKTGSETC